ncbi:MAG TPA: DUF6760 family protein [Streptosporangiaceae bacterium]|nr:DUF6760 family protein [Streptosporangiaceae bacterium]
MRPRVRRRFLGGSPGPPGGVLTYGTEQLLEEVSYVAYHFHWPLAEILDLEHPLRRAFAAQIDVISARLASGVSEDDDYSRTGW